MENKSTKKSAMPAGIRHRARGPVDKAKDFKGSLKRLIKYCRLKFLERLLQNLEIM